MITLSTDSKVLWDLIRGLQSKGYKPELIGFGLKFNNRTGEITGDHSVILKVPEAEEGLIEWVRDNFTDLTIPGHWKYVTEIGTAIDFTDDLGILNHWTIRTFCVDSLSMDGPDMIITFSGGNCHVHTETIMNPVTKSQDGWWTIKKT